MSENISKIEYELKNLKMEVVNFTNVKKKKKKKKKKKSHLR